MSLEHEPSSELIHISAKQLFYNAFEGNKKNGFKDLVLKMAHVKAMIWPRLACMSILPGVLRQALYTFAEVLLF